jgi:hypothetical protein
MGMQESASVTRPLLLASLILFLAPHIARADEVKTKISPPQGDTGQRLLIAGSAALAVSYGAAFAGSSFPSCAACDPTVARLPIAGPILFADEVPSHPWLWRADGIAQLGATIALCIGLAQAIDAVDKGEPPRYDWSLVPAVGPHQAMLAAAATF